MEILQCKAAGLITGIHNGEHLAPVSNEERAARFSQVPTIVLLTGTARVEFAYQLERRLFDNGHATTVLEATASATVLSAIKNAGLIGLCIETDKALVDIAFDTDNQSLDDIYALLKEQKIIY